MRAFKLSILIAILLQILDGLFTYIGVLRYGIDIEGNILIHTLMLFYVPEVLFVVKTVAVLLLILFYFLINIKETILLILFFIINVVYLIVVCHWAYILFNIP